MVLSKNTSKNILSGSARKKAISFTASSRIWNVHSLLRLAGSTERMEELMINFTNAVR